ncbi:MAG: SRPBCC domain-containing protein [Candidatus Promineifilaceae bacterium]|nr:SRPBCC domain-containing protein [Candidatus Promineifilaceae bacterium]
MELSDTIEVGAARERVWTFLSDPYALGGCIPGLERVEIFEPEGAFGGAAIFPLGSTELRVPARVEWREQEPPHRGRLYALLEVKTFAVQVDGTVALQAVAEHSTEISWHAQVEFPEALASNPMLVTIGQNVAARFIKTVLECLQGRLESGAES